MSSLREIKDRIGSVRSTLKITSAMKLVSSSKLRKAQKAIEGLRPYENVLAEILSTIDPQVLASVTKELSAKDEEMDEELSLRKNAPVAVVAVSSNSSLCGAFNANVIRKAAETLKEFGGNVKVFPIGRKMAEAMKKLGFLGEADCNDIIAHTDYDRSAALAHELCDRYNAGEFSRVVLVYNRFVSTSQQVPTVENYLPLSGDLLSSVKSSEPSAVDATEYILEPDAEEIVRNLLPQVLTLKFHAAVLDSAAAEQAARTIAMQTATDNAEDLLGELTLEYNKGRQQKITSEILDLVGGSAEQ